MRSSPHKRWLRPLLVAPVALVLGASVALGTAGAARLLTTGATPAPTLMDCGPGVPLVKCNESLYSPNPALTIPPAAGGVPSTAAPETSACGPSFFDLDQLQRLSAQFGSIECFQFVGSTSWIVIGDGMSLTAPVDQATPGGAIVAVLTCAAGDKVCTDPTGSHDFGAFRVSYPPSPSSGRTQLQFTESQRFLVIYDAYCGLFTFDTSTMKWYQPQATIRQSLLSGGTATQVEVPASVSGTTALANSAPAGTNDCQAIAP